MLEEWTATAIFETHVNIFKDKTTIKTYKQNIGYMNKRGFKPEYNIIDNVAMEAVTVYPEENESNIQLIKPYNHQANVAGRNIQMF